MRGKTDIALEDVVTAVQILPNRETTVPINGLTGQYDLVTVEHH